MAAPDLTTRDAVKTYRSITGVQSDTLIDGLVTSVSLQIEGFTFRTLAQVLAVVRSYRGPADSAAIILEQWPVANLTVTEDGAALVEGTDYEVLDERRLVRISGNDEIRWVHRIKVSVTADEGYAPVPADLELAAREQTSFAFKQSTPGGGLLGIASRTGGTGGSEETFDSYVGLTSNVVQILKRYRRFS